MRAVFADTVYWVAIAHPRDSLHRHAIEMSRRLGPHRIVTPEMVLTEFLNILCGYGAHFRLAAATLADRAAENPGVDAVPQTAELFHAALALYRSRPDQSWSLTDCASFVIMDRQKITEALTHDRHFEQNGYRALLRDTVPGD